MPQRSLSRPITGEVPQQRSSGLLPVVLGLVALLALLVYFCDTDGYEGDDLNSVVPMFYLAAAKAGLLEIYRYAWQPLSYEVGAAVYRLTRAPQAVFFLAPVSAAVSIAFLLAAARRVSEDPRRMVLAVVMLSAAPELLFSGLYYNSSIIALAAHAAALWTVTGRSQPSQALLAGGLAAMSVLLRLDFALALPALVMLALHRRWAMRDVALLAMTAAVIVGVCVAMNLPNLVEVGVLYRSAGEEIAARAHEPGWDLRTKLFVTTVVLSPLGFAATLLVVGRSASTMLRGQGVGRTVGWLCAILPLLLLLRAPLSPKYVLPLLPYWFLFVTSAVGAMLDSRPGSARFWTTLLVVIAVAQYLLPLDSLTQFGRIGRQLGGEVGTHDGTRSYGGYLWQMNRVQRAAPADAARGQALQLAASIRSSGVDTVLIGKENYFEPGAVAWRHLVLHLERAGIHGTVIGPRRLLFDLDGKNLLLATDPLPCPSRPYSLAVPCIVRDLR